eukprot:TRINITY_DN1629_c4_g2_i1.p1 TRINITY_DN1629_c4_g2~~TRINITY_DN1629_c4_g2_i1.p1  ORF type:complete len:277 (-),score=33.73 TRINITY_DN1629_c4_g2_i1:34-864(-)
MLHSYLKWMNQSYNIVTCNKKPHSGSSFEHFLDLTRDDDLQKGKCLFRSTVGAGLPIINTLYELVNTGDKVLSIEGILSGTLSYLFGQLSSGGRDQFKNHHNNNNNNNNYLKFSEIVKRARELGYTEPDPRDDLSALDFGRKLVILARIIGIPVTLETLSIKSLVPEKLRHVPLDEFLKRIGEIDEVMEPLRENCKMTNTTLRYLGRIDVENKKVSLELVSTPLSSSDPYSSLSGTDNIVFFKTKRYPNNLVIQGPGAGGLPTASGLFADMLKIIY